MGTACLCGRPTKDMSCKPTPSGVPGAGQRASLSSSTTAARSTISLFQPIRLRPIRPGRKLSGPRFNLARRFSIRGRPGDSARRCGSHAGTSVRCRHCLTLALGVCLSRTRPPATHPAGRPARASRDPCGPGRRMAHHRRERHEWERVLDEPCPLSAAGGDAPGWRPHPLPAAQVGGAAMTGAELLVRCLDREGVEYVLGHEHHEQGRGIDRSIVGNEGDLAARRQLPFPVFVQDLPRLLVGERVLLRALMTGRNRSVPRASAGSKGSIWSAVIRLSARTARRTRECRHRRSAPRASPWPACRDPSGRARSRR